MVDRDLIENFDEPIRQKIRDSIALLASSGVLLAQKQRLFARVAEGSDTAPTETIAEAVLSYRKDSHALVALQQLGESIIEEDQ